MILDKIYPYSKPVKYEYNGSLMDKFKKVLDIQDCNEYHDSNVTKFYHQLMDFSKQFGLGDNISFETVFEEFTPEYIFTIHIPKHISKDAENELFMKLNFLMQYFCKKNKMSDFLKDAYIIFD